MSTKSYGDGKYFQSCDLGKHRRKRWEGWHMCLHTNTSGCHSDLFLKLDVRLQSGHYRRSKFISNNPTRWKQIIGRWLKHLRRKPVDLQGQTYRRGNVEPSLPTHSRYIEYDHSRYIEYGRSGIEMNARRTRVRHFHQLEVQVLPFQASLQLQKKPATKSMQSPSFLHGFGSQSSWSAKEKLFY